MPLNKEISQSNQCDGEYLITFTTSVEGVTSTLMLIITSETKIMFEWYR